MAMVVEAAEGLSSWVMAGIVGAQAALSVTLLARGGWRKSAATDAKRDGDIATLIAQMSRLVAAIDRQTDKHNDHVLEDTRIHERLTVVQEQLTATAAALRASLDNQQSQISNMANGLAPAAAREVPPTRRRGL